MTEWTEIKTPEEFFQAVDRFDEVESNYPIGGGRSDWDAVINTNQYDRRLRYRSRPKKKTIVLREALKMKPAERTDMTHSGKKPHAVGYKGQRYEVSIFDEAAEGRRVVGWTNDAEKASQMATDADRRPGWSFAWVTDLTTDISHTKRGKWIGERPLPANANSTTDSAG